MIEKDEKLEKMLEAFGIDKVKYLKKDILRLDRLQRLDILLWLIMCVYEKDRDFQVTLAKVMYRSFLKDQCPYCLGNKIVKNGLSNKKEQYYMCKSCGKRFTIDSLDDIELPFRKED